MESENITTETTAADLRRELRRKKVLESAKSRLEKLNGRIKPAGVHEDIVSNEEAVEFSDPEVELNIPTGNTFFAEEPNISFFSTNTFSPTTTEVPNIYIRSRVHIFIASIIGYFLSLYIKNMLFAPVGLCIMIELFFFRDQSSHNNNIVNVIVPIALMFSGARLSNKIKQVSYLFAISQSLIVNLAINIFCICVASFLYQYKSDANFVVVK
ncbi:uncharacterized protein LOC108596703 [Drosophila busckii]|uniref:uncharacterized protein LOC108596703 n=1 Tax=Drosophila busckii TaxID=30019 RepID=UPI001432B61C|nr:uncharacterized protein LOC108596703 [Drosophila busckii]